MGKGSSAGVDAAGADVKDAAGADVKGLGPSAGIDGAGSSSDDMLEIRRKHALGLLELDKGATSPPVVAGVTWEEMAETLTALRV